MPALTPETTPDVTVATPVAPLAHDPPDGDPVSVKLPPTHKELPPEILDAETTVIELVTIEVPTAYVMVHVPAATPVTTPVEPIVAIEVLLLLHVPPVVASVNAVVEPTHPLVAPDIAATEVPDTVTTKVEKHPVGSVYVTTHVPNPTPVTTPLVDPIVRIEQAAVHVPPVDGSVSVMNPPTVTVVGPAMADGIGLTVKLVVTIPP